MLDNTQHDATPEAIAASLIVTTAALASQAERKLGLTDLQALRRLAQIALLQIDSLTVFGMGGKETFAS